MSGAHTPGPWTAKPLGSWNVVWSGDEPGHEVVAEVDRKCDMSIIAAAPDMLEALKAAAMYIGTTDRGAGILRTVQSAIAKAEGQS